MKKTSITLLFVLFLLCFISCAKSTSPRFSYKNEPWDGVTTEDPALSSDGIIRIYNPEQLAGLAKNVNNGTNTYEGKTILIMNDINMNNKDAFMGIGYFEYNGTNRPFKGNIDGQNKNIINLKMDKHTGSVPMQGLGLVGYLDSGSVKNITVKGNIGTSTYSVGQYAGGIVGYNLNGTITGCTNYANIGHGVANFAGGICGANKRGTVSMSKNYGNINARNGKGDITGGNI